MPARDRLTRQKMYRHLVGEHGWSEAEADRRAREVPVVPWEPQPRQVAALRALYEGKRFACRWVASGARRAILESEDPEHFVPMTGAEKIAFTQYKRAIRGGIRHAIEIADRGEGKVTQRLAGADDDEITIRVRRLE